MLVLLTSMAVAATPALAAENTIAADDPCGDNHGYAFADGQSVDLPPTERSPRYDLQRVALSQTLTGLRVTITQCAAIGEPDGLRAFRGAYASLPGDCVVGVGAEEAIAPGQPRTGYFFKSCFQVDNGPLSPIASDNNDERFRITLPAGAVAVAGNTLTVDVARAGLTGEAAATLAPGAVWERPWGVGVEGSTLSGGGFSWSDDGTTHHWGSSAPAAYDFADINGSLTFQ